MRGNVDPAWFRELVTAMRADVVALQESDAEHFEALAAAEWPHGQFEPKEDHTGMGIALRNPVAGVTPVPMVWRDAWEARLEPYEAAARLAAAATAHKDSAVRLPRFEIPSGCGIRSDGPLSSSALAPHAPRQPAVAAGLSRSARACSRGFISSFCFLGRRLTARGSTRFGRWPTLRLAIESSFWSAKS